MAVKAGDHKWTVATKSGSPKRFAREVKVVRVLRPLPGDPFDCAIEDLEEGHQAYAASKCLFDTQAEAEKEALKNSKPSIVLLGSFELKAATRLIATAKE